jgi:hypothetical protein
VVEHLTNDQAEKDIASRFQTLDLSSTPPNPFLIQPLSRTTGYDLFLSQDNRAREFSTQPTTALNPQIGANLAQAPDARRRSYTPAVGRSEYDIYARDHQSTTRATSGFLAPGQLSFGQERQNTRHHSKRSQTPAIGHSQPEQYGASLRRPQSAQVRSSSRSAESPSTSWSNPGSNTTGMKVVRQSQWRGFFKAGRVCVPYNKLWHT